MKNSSILIILAMTISACSQRVLDFTMISTKNVDLSRSQDLKRAAMRVTGEDSRSIIIIVPTGDPSTKEAVDNAIESVRGCVGLVDGVITSSWWYIPYIFGQVSIEVEGTPLIDVSQLHK